MKNPGLGYVCVSEDMTGEFGLCGYFQEYDHELRPEERLRFAKGELPPPFVEAEQPSVPQDQWDEERLEKANRNYALTYIRNGLSELVKVMDRNEALELAKRAARLIGLQYFAKTLVLVGGDDGNLEDCAAYLAAMFGGMGDTVRIEKTAGGVELRQEGIRAIRGLPEVEAGLVFDCWAELWCGACRSQRLLKTLSVDREGDRACWRIELAS